MRHVSKNLELIRSFVRERPISGDNLTEFVTASAGVFACNGIDLLELTSGGNVVASEVYGATPDVLEDYLDHYSQINPRIPATDPTKLIVTDQTMFQDSDILHKSEFFDWFFTKCESSDCLSFKLPRSGGGSVILALMRENQHGYYQEDHRQLASVLYPEIEANLRISSYFSSGMPFADLIMERADSPKGLIVLDLSGRVHSVNETALSIAANNRALRLSHSRLSMTSWQPSFEKLCQRVLRGKRIGSFTINERDQIINVTVLPFYTTSIVFQRRYLLVELEVVPPSSLLDRLAPSERDVCDLILTGLNLREIADIRGRSYNTCRNQLATIHEKLGTRSIAELLLRYGAPDPGHRK